MFKNESSKTYTIIGSVVGAVLLSTLLAGMIVCIKKKSTRNGIHQNDTQERRSLDHIHIQGNEAYVLTSINSISTGQNAAYGVVESSNDRREEDKGGYIISNTYQPREDNSIEDGGNHPLYEDTSSPSHLTENLSMSAYDYVLV